MQQVVDLHWNNKALMKILHGSDMSGEKKKHKKTHHEKIYKIPKTSVEDVYFNPSDLWNKIRIKQLISSLGTLKNF